MMRGIAVGSAAIGLVLAVASSAAHDIVSDGDATNDWIMRLRNRSNVQCCGFNDCYPVEPTAVRFAQHGRLTVKINDEWFEVWEESVVPARSEDGRAWVCPQWHFEHGYLKVISGVRCLILPPSM